jgi:uncharacterized protein (TIGR03435 family)
MPRQLLSNALEDAERAEPAVQAAALFHIARVMNAFDHDEAERLMERAITVADRLPEPERTVILAEGVSPVATVSPTRALHLAESIADAAIPGGVLTKALFDMLSHGRVEEAIAYLAEPTLDKEYPFAAALQAMSRADDAARVRILRAALASMRRNMNALDTRGFDRRMETRIFTRWWHLLPSDEAKAFVGDLVRSILAQPDHFIRATVQDVTFSSTHEQQLFELLGPIRHLDPELAEALIGTHLQLAAAAAQYPYGHESIEEAARRRIASRPPTAPVEQPPVFMMAGNRLISLPEAVRTDFKEPFDAALRAYAVDTYERRPNDAPQECWPSTQEFRTILYKAGAHEGRAAIRLLDRIPDATLRLFAQIELAAALAGLPQIGGTSITPGPHGFRGSWELEQRAARQATAPVLPFPVRPAPAKRPNVPPSNDARIAPTRHAIAEGPSGGSGPDYWVIENATLKPVLANLYDSSETRIDVAAPLDSTAYDFVLVLPHSVTRETMIRLMRESVEKQFHVTRELRTMEVDVLTAPGGITAPEAHADDVAFGFGSIGFAQLDRGGATQPPDGFELAEIMNLHTVPSEAEDDPDADLRQMKNLLMKFSSHSMRSTGGSLTSIADVLTMAELCQLLENNLNRPVIDDTGVAGRYAVNVHTDTVVDPREFMNVLCDALGLVLKSERRDLSVLVVRAR